MIQHRVRAERDGGAVYDGAIQRGRHRNLVQAQVDLVTAEPRLRVHKVVLPTGRGTSVSRPTTSGAQGSQFGPVGAGGGITITVQLRHGISEQTLPRAGATPRDQRADPTTGRSDATGSASRPYHGQEQRHGISEQTLPRGGATPRDQRADPTTGRSDATGSASRPYHGQERGGGGGSSSTQSTGPVTRPRSTVRMKVNSPATRV